MAIGLRVHEGTERHDFPTAGARIPNRVGRQSLSCTCATQGVRDFGMVNDDESRTDAGKCHLRRAADVARVQNRLGPDT